MNYILLLTTTLTLAAQSIVTKQYGKKGTNGPITFGALSAFFAMGMFLVSSGLQLEFQAGLWIYSLLFAVSYAAALLGLTIAMGCGPLSITSLIFSYSLIIPTLYGILFAGEPVSWTMGIGFFLLVLSLFLINFTSEKYKKEPTGISKKWLLSTVVAFVGNGMCSTVQKVQQVAFAGKGKNELMISALLIAAAILWIAAGVWERKSLALSLRKGWHLGAVCGVVNGVTNLLVMILGNRIPVSLLFPVVSAGSIVISSLVSLLVYHEKLRPIQLIGVSIGVGSIVFLNL